jgi:hypothetical protein
MFIILSLFLLLLFFKYYSSSLIAFLLLKVNQSTLLRRPSTYLPSSPRFCTFLLIFYNYVSLLTCVSSFSVSFSGLPLRNQEFAVHRCSEFSVLLLAGWIKFPQDIKEVHQFEMHLFTLNYRSVEFRVEFSATKLTFLLRRFVFLLEVVRFLLFDLSVFLC